MNSKLKFRSSLRSVLVLLLLNSVLTSGCTTSDISKRVSGSQSRFDEALAHGRCTEAAENIPEKDGSIKFLGRVDRASGTVVSYAATGVGYTADVALTIAGGAILLMALSAPYYAPVQVVNPNPVDPRQAISLGDLPLPTIGSAIYNHTAGIRCPDLTSLSRSVRRVAACMQKSDSKSAVTVTATAASQKNSDQNQQLILAKKTLDSVATNQDVMNCITPEEKTAVQSAEFTLDQMIARLPASASN